MEYVLAGAPVFFPLDEELGLLPGDLTPLVHEWVVRLAVWATFGPAAQMVGDWAGVAVSEATATRKAEAAGAALVAGQTAAVERLERDLPEGPRGPAVQQLGVDGAYVPLVGGEWAEVKTLAVGTVGSRLGRDGQPAACTQELSYFSRLADAAQFRRLALGELHRRGTATAGVVCAVQDGAVWQQGFVDEHRPDAVRILDFMHGAEHLAEAARAVWGVGSAAVSEWLGVQLHELKHGDPDAVLTALAALPVHEAGNPQEAAKVRDRALAYLEARREQIQYARFVAQGYPIGSGSVESANKLVVEARLKGSGMRWARPNVNPMLALRTVVCSDRWAEEWPHVEETLRQQVRQERCLRRQGRQASTQPSLQPLPPAAPTASPPPAEPAVAAPVPRRKLVVNGRPTPEHPWKRTYAGQARPKFTPHTKL